MASSQIVEISRRITRQLDLGKGMFFDADMLRVLAECGAVELIQKVTSDHLRERAAEQLKAREPQSDLPNSRRHRPAERRSGGRRSGGSDFFEGEPLSHTGAPVPSESGREALARAQRTLASGPNRIPSNNVHVLRPKQARDTA